MLNPRHIYIRALLESGIDARTEFIDYFEYENFELSSNKNNKIKVLAKLIQTNKGSNSLKKAYLLFQDINTRITLDGLLLSYSVSDIAEIQSISPDVLYEYLDYFFSLDEIIDDADKLIFYNSIPEISDKALAWFQLCFEKNLDKLKFVSKGIVKRKPPSEIYDIILNREMNLYENLTSKWSSEIGSTGPTQSDLVKYSMASKARSTVLSLLNIYSKNPASFGGSSEDFVTKYTQMLDLVRAEAFESVHADPEEEAEINRQLDEISFLANEEDVEMIDRNKNNDPI